MIKRTSKCYEEAFQQLKEAANTVLSNIPEARSCISIIDWELGSSEFPAGLMVFREGQDFNIEASLALLKQTQKMMAYQIDRLRITLGAIEDASKQLAEKLKEQNEKGRIDSTPSDTA